MEPSEIKEAVRAAAKRKRKLRESRKQIRSVSVKNPNFLFSLSLAAFSNPENPYSKSLVEACLSEFHRRLLLLQSPDSFSLPSDDLLFNSILGLLPLLLNSRCLETVSAGLKIFGAASLVSYEMNERIAMGEAETLRIVFPKVLCGENRVAMAACNAVLDVATTSLGRKKLLELSALNYLMLGFVQVMKSSSPMASLCIMDNEGVLYLCVELLEDELPLLLLTVSVLLVNSCNMEQLHQLPRELVKESLGYMKRLWAKLREQILCADLKKTLQRRKSSLSNLTVDNLTEGIFRLSLNEDLDSGMTSDVIVRRIFGVKNTGFADFILNYWESSPFLMRNGHMNLQHDIFGLFAQLFNSESSTQLCFSSILRGMVSCYPIASNEMDILEFLKEVRSLACPVIYHQDIRVLRTESDLKTEKHFFGSIPVNHSTKVANVITINDILKCEEAYNEGFTMALRGMEFRLKSIAAITNELATLFGQPSAGANLYLTPPNSQGLACHYDDHCVFVLQLHGSKLWTIYPQPFVQLPRLYDSLVHPPDSVAGSKEILLHEGDVLYIPRGFPHKACTFVGSCGANADSDFSLHLTLGVETEPPFEWEGFMHLALHHWGHYSKVSDDSQSCPFDEMEIFSLYLLHASIRIISNSDSTFRKACLAGAVSLSSESEGWLDQNQRVMFYQLIGKILELSTFSASMQYIQKSAQMTDDPFPWVRWLYLLNDVQMARHKCIFSPEEIREHFASVEQNHDKAASVYGMLKSKFCSEVSFDAVRERFKMLHAAFKKVRKQYMNGMLSLHF